MIICWFKCWLKSFYQYFLHPQSVHVAFGFVEEKVTLCNLLISYIPSASIDVLSEINLYMVFSQCQVLHTQHIYLLEEHESYKMFSIMCPRIYVSLFILQLFTVRVVNQWHFTQWRTQIRSVDRFFSS